MYAKPLSNVYSNVYKYVLHMKRDPHTLIKCELWKTMLLDITLYMSITLTYVCKALIKCVLKCVQICTAYEKNPTHPYQMWTVKNNVTWHHIMYITLTYVCKALVKCVLCSHVCTVYTSEKRSYTTENSPKNLKRTLRIWKEPYTSEKEQHIWKETYTSEKRALHIWKRTAHLKRDLYIWKKSPTHLTRDQYL